MTMVVSGYVKDMPTYLKIKLQIISVRPTLTIR